MGLEPHALPATACAVFVENKDDGLNIMCCAGTGGEKEIIPRFQSKYGWRTSRSGFYFTRGKYPKASAKVTRATVPDHTLAREGTRSVASSGHSDTSCPRLPETSDTPCSIALQSDKPPLLCFQCFDPRRLRIA
ncbi:hypothetical protein SKAU_G00053970 [Synaphobranchus kaupii]|uniref:Uncharacterized protein n=1 Tax=Synaphobranchus kaupii TaxID=118154 RepID=A0A9Q1G4M3_SYNKA|nr:hypothetical protein SKAU_G00053970 [Synaphobranchus kaupii]